MSKITNYPILKHKNIILIFCIAMTYAVIILFPDFSAQWGLIDDHVIITAMGTNHKLLLKDIPNFIANIPEIGSIGHYPRVQPFYILFTIVQAHFLGDHIVLWYTIRVIGFGISLFIFTLISLELFGRYCGLLLMVVVASHQCWGDIWARIGPAEIYATPLFAIFGFAFLRLWKNDSRHNTIWYLILTITAILLLGTKENMLFVLPVTAFLTCRNWRKHRITTIQFMMTMIAILWGLFIVGAIYLGLQNNGEADFYGTPMNFFYRLKTLYTHLNSYHIEYPAYIPYFVSIIFYIALKGYKNFTAGTGQTNVKLEAGIIRLFYVESILFVLWGFQLLVYIKNHIPNGSRYDFPGILFVDLAYLSIAYFVVKSACCYHTSYYSSMFSSRFKKNVMFIIAIILISYRIPYSFAIYNTALKNSVKTQKIHNLLLRAKTLTMQYPNVPIVLVSHWVWDYEPINAMRQYLSIDGIKNPLAIKVEGYSEDTVKGILKKNLAKELILRSRNGAPQTREAIAPSETIFLPYYPLKSILKAKRACFMIGFSGPANLPCTNLGTVYH